MHRRTKKDYSIQSRDKIGQGNGSVKIEESYPKQFQLHLFQYLTNK